MERGPHGGAGTHAASELHVRLGDTWSQAWAIKRRKISGAFSLRGIAYAPDWRRHAVRHGP
jgi:hypothetical protein